MSHGVVQAAIKVAKMYKHNTGVGKKIMFAQCKFASYISHKQAGTPFYTMFCILFELPLI